MNSEILQILNCFAKTLNLATENMDSPIILKDKVVFAMREAESKMQRLEMAILDELRKTKHGKARNSPRGRSRKSTSNTT